MSFSNHTEIPDDRADAVIRTRLTDTLVNMFRNNPSFLAASEVEKDLEDVHDTFPYILTAPASPAGYLTPKRIILTYEAGEHSITLPPGRIFGFGQSANIIENITVIFPTEQLPWEEMVREYKRLVALWDAAGWTRHTTAPHLPAVIETIRPEDFHKSLGINFVEIGEWRAPDAPYVVATLTVEHYNSSPSASVTPPAVLSKPLPKDAPDRYLFKVYFQINDDAVEEEIYDLYEARRINVNGSKDKELPLSVWLEDPDWRPDGWNGKYIK